MKARELRPCDACGKPLLHTGVPLLWRVRIEHHAVDLGAVQRRTGLQMMLGGSNAIADAMGPDEDMTQAIGDAQDVLVCQTCAMEYPVAALAEVSAGRAEMESAP